MGFDIKSILNKILELLTLGKSLGLFDKDGNPIHTPEELHSHLEDQINE